MRACWLAVIRWGEPFCRASYGRSHLPMRFKRWVLSDSRLFSCCGLLAAKNLPDPSNLVPDVTTCWGPAKNPPIAGQEFAGALTPAGIVESIRNQAGVVERPNLQGRQSSTFNASSLLRDHRYKVFGNVSRTGSSILREHDATEKNADFDECRGLPAMSAPAGFPTLDLSSPPNGFSVRLGFQHRGRFPFSRLSSRPRK